MVDNKHIRFSAVLTPNRSLSRRGFIILMSMIGLISFAAGVVFVSMGAWPVFGFFGLDVVLIYWAFKKNFSDCEMRELVEITDRELVVRCFRPRKPVQEHRFVRHWVRLELAEDKAREVIGALTVSSHGKRMEIARFLGPKEKKEFFSTLYQALNPIRAY